MNALSTEQACFIIIKAREFDVKQGASGLDDGSNPTDDGMAEVLEDSPDDPVRDEIAGFIDGLNVDARIELVALAWLGRDENTREDWPELVRQAGERANAYTADYLLGTPLLADYLEQGLETLGFSCSDVEASHL